MQHQQTNENKHFSLLYLGPLYATNVLKSTLSLKTKNSKLYFNLKATLSKEKNIF